MGWRRYARELMGESRKENGWTGTTDRLETYPTKQQVENLLHTERQVENRPAPPSFCHSIFLPSPSLTARQLPLCSAHIVLPTSKRQPGCPRFRRQSNGSRQKDRMAKKWTTALRE